jgi:YVTN family beta-propeller protein
MIARRVCVGLALLLLVTLLATAAPESKSKRPRYKSPLGLAVDPTGRFAYVALHTANTLAVVDLNKNSVQCEIFVGRKPYDVAFHKGIAYVTCEADDTLVAVDVAARKVQWTFRVGQAPRGVSIDPDTELIQVVCHDEKVLWSQNSRGDTWTEPIPPQPEGNFARASNFELIFGKDEATYRQAPRPFNLFTRGQSIFDSMFALASPDNGPNGVAARPNNGLKEFAARFAGMGMVERAAFNPLFDLDYSRTGMDLVAHTRPRWFIPTGTAADGRVFTNAFSFFLNQGGIAGFVLLDEPTKGYPDPTDVVVKLPKQGPERKPLPPLSKRGMEVVHPLKDARVFISSGGADTVLVLDMDKAAKHAVAHPMGGGMMGMTGGGWGGPMSGGMMGGSMMGGWSGGSMSGGAGLNGMQMGGGMTGVQGGVAVFGEDLRASANYTLARLPTQANPRRMVLTPDGKILVVSNHLADSLTLIDTDKLKILRHIDLGGPKPDTARRGEILFHSAKHTVQQQFTCASCHPNNGSDGLSWETSSKPTGEHLNTRALHGVRDTVPFGWKGNSQTLQDRAKNTMREVHKHKLSDADASAIAAYLETLDPLRPLPQKAKDMPAIDRGKALFFGKANCKSCHRGPAYTSETPRAVIQDHQKKLVPYDVPSLRGVARTAPYLHDGRAATLEEIFQQHNPLKRHGLAHDLTGSELRDVVMFLKSL